MADARLLKIKATLKKRQPKFIRQDAHKHKRVKQVWRKPKGLHSKMKDSRKGYRAKLQEGYHTPKAVRGLDKHGLKPTHVANAATLADLDPKIHSIIVLGGLGGRKKIALLEEAAKRKFTVLNATADTADKLKSRLQKQHQEKKQKEAEKAQKQKSLEEKEKKNKAESEKHDHKHEGEHNHDHKHGSEEKSEHQKEEDAEKHKTLHHKKE